MRCLTVDFGSTYTKLALIDTEQRAVLATASAFTTIDTDVQVGFNNAKERLQQRLGAPLTYDDLICCSSAAGGLKMVALGLVPSLTAQAARLAANSAGAKVVKTYAYEISHAEQEEIYQINPDLVLLCGGTDGGNKEVILANARRLIEIDRPFAVIVAGNKTASYELETLFAQSNKRFVVTENVMPEFNKLNIEPAKKCIMELFISRIIDAKGLTGIQEQTAHKIIPTPLAVLNACKLLSNGTEHTPGWGDLLAVDLGGATTDIYSMSNGTPTRANVMLKGLPEPYAKRTVEGDLGMRYSLHALREEISLPALSEKIGVPEEQIEDWVIRCAQDPALVAEPGSTEQRIEEGLAHSAVEKATERHAGYMQQAYTPLGELFALYGKDLTEVPCVIGIGGALINSANPTFILQGALFNPADPMRAKPVNPRFYLDKQYIVASMGLLSTVDPECALEILKRETVRL